MPARWRRRLALLRVALLALFAAAPGLTQTYDVLLKGGHVIDPASEIDRVIDIAVAGNTIATVAPDIPPDQAKKTINAAGYYVTPGLVDIHTHVFGYQGWIWPDDTQLTQGTTTVVDCGGSGWRTFDEFKETVIDRTKTRVYAFINIVGKGMVGGVAENDVTDMGCREDGGEDQAVSRVDCRNQDRPFWSQGISPA